MGETIHAPWTPEQVEALNRWQANPAKHPFTCGPCRDAAPFPLPEQFELVATEFGWVCRHCDYTQTTAFAVMARPESTP